MLNIMQRNFGATLTCIIIFTLTFIAPKIIHDVCVFVGLMSS